MEELKNALEEKQVTMEKKSCLVIIGAPQW